MRGLVKAEQRLLARFERELIGPSDPSPSGSSRVASTYLRIRHQVLYGAIRRRFVWIGSAWKVVLALTLRPGDTFVDVGANIGLVTQPASWLVGRGGQVHSFEPSPSIAARLRRRVTLLKLDVEVSRYTNASFGRSIDELLAAIAALGYTMYSWRRDGLAQIQTADDVPAAWQRDDAICLYLPRHDGLYEQLLALAERRRERP